MDKQLELTFDERVLHEAFGELLVELRQLGQSAPDGTVLDGMEGLVLGKGRDLLRRSLQTQLQAATEAAEKKRATPARAAAPRRKTKAPAPATS